ncbi:MAG TPA: Mur ligase family protein [Acidimicrobiia bacterium]|nr:Mur ligase family protein [Acidimicrobiia bacterium]
MVPPLPETLLAVAGLAVSAVASLRWLRIAQREHYLAPAVGRFAWRWWASSPVNLALGLTALATVVLSFREAAWGWLALTVLLYGPWGLSLRGVSSPLVWTPRLRRLAAAVAGLVAVAEVLALAMAPAVIVLACLALPVLTDLALILLGPLERRLGDPWVLKAQARLAASGARVVAITGSYGKTTTKSYLTHLLAGWRQTVASPASFNNRMGLARAINENLGPGTEVFVAEMGTYGPLEIADLCRFVKPDIALITAIGPVHLERFKSLEAITAAKREILEAAPVAVLNIDHPELKAVADEEKDLRKVVTASASDRTAAVAVVEGRLWVDEVEVAKVGDEGFPSNLALAVAAALQLGMPFEHLRSRLGDLPPTPHRRQLITSEHGFAIIDDTYNSNPTGAEAALAELAVLAPRGRRAVVTPGMVELGRRQRQDNRAFAARAAQVATDLIVVGRTNRRALIEGAQAGQASVTVMPSRPAAVDWVRHHLGPGDAVLYENDLPDHYP